MIISSLLGLIKFGLIVFEFEVEYFHRMFAKRFPFYLFESGNVHCNCFDVSHNFLDSTVNINLFWERLCFCSQNMFWLLYWLRVIEEIPTKWWSHRIEFLSFLIEMDLMLIKFLAIFRSKFLFILDTLLNIYINYITDILFGLLLLETLETL